MISFSLLSVSRPSFAIRCTIPDTEAMVVPTCSSGGMFLR